MDDGKHLQRDLQDIGLLEHGSFCECIWCVERDITIESEDFTRLSKQQTSQ